MHKKFLILSLASLFSLNTFASDDFSRFQSIRTNLISNFVKQAALMENVPVSILLGICKVESNLNPKAIHHDDGGSNSIGLCQIKAETAKLYGYKSKKESLLDPSVNAKYAARHIHALLRKYNNSDYAIAAYNLGSLKLNSRGMIWNRSYVKKVRAAIEELRLAP